jgi:hypothetical protein
MPLELTNREWGPLQLEDLNSRHKDSGSHGIILATSRGPGRTIKPDRTEDRLGPGRTMEEGSLPSKEKEKLKPQKKKCMILRSYKVH